jgi:hypothetical protein
MKWTTSSTWMRSGTMPQKKDMTCYLHPDEDEPHKTIRNKNPIGKVIFLAAVSKPRFDNEGNCTFDGKLGI